MKSLVAIIIKFVGVCAVAWVAFMVFGTVAFWTVFTIACAVTVLNYLIGDMWILPKWGNIWASIIDGVVAGAAAWVILYYTPAAYNFNAWVWTFALIIAVAEFFYHIYLVNADVVEKKRSDYTPKKNLNLNTESGSELFPYSRRVNSEGNSGSFNSRLKNENNFGDTNYDAGDSDTGGDWYNGDKNSGNVEGSSGNGRKGGKNRTK